MKGHTKIELTNVETGDTEVYEDDNLFTDIFGELVNDNNFGVTAISKEPSTFLPLSTAALRGIVLFSEAQTASATNMYPTQAAMAYAGSDTDAGSNVYKGTYNVTESGAITNGYKHVWDFTTSQGNGEIASVSLVHPACGNSWPTSSIQRVMQTGEASGFMGRCKLINQSAQLFIGYDPSSQHIQVRRIETILDSLSSVNARPYGSACPYTVEKDIVIDNETDKSHAAAGMVWRIDETNAIGYGHSENASGDAYIYVITVDVNTLDYTESSITISGTAIRSFGTGYCQAVTRNGYLYCRRSGDRKLLKINLSNTTDITEINDTNGNLGYNGVLDYVLLSGSQYLFPDDTIGTGADFRVSDYYGIPNPIATIGTKELVSVYYSYGGYYVFYIDTPKIYLGTINNLDSPVVKTASQTMKITYTITDSTEVVLRGISVTHAPNTTRFAKGTALDTTGLEVTAAYSGNTTEVVTSSCVLSPANGSTLSDTSVSSIGISFTDGDITRTTSTPILVYAPSSLTVTSQPTQTVYSEGDTLDLTGVAIRASYSDGTSEIVTNSCTFSPANGATLSSGTSSVSVTYTLGSETVTTSIPITVQAATLSSIAVTTMPTATTFSVGGTLDLTGIVVTATYSDSTTAVVTGGCVFSPANGSTLSTAGTQAVTVSYTAGTVTKTTSFNVTVESQTVYGFHIDGTVSDPSQMISYAVQYNGANVKNYNYTPAAVNLTTGVMDPGDWNLTDDFFVPRSCMLKYDGTVDYYLDEDDETLKEDGTASDVANTDYEGNAMMEWGRAGQRIYTKIVPDSTPTNGATIYVSNARLDSGFTDYSFYDQNGVEINHFYTPKYNGANVSSKLRSISGLAPINNQTGSTEATYAAANNVNNAVEWDTETWCDRTLIDILLLMIGKSTNTQAVFGEGYSDGGSSASSLATTGTLNGKGQWYGSSTNNSSTEGVKVFGMEHWWGNQWRRLRGILNISGTVKYKMTYSTVDGSTQTGYDATGSGYKTVASGTPDGTSGGYINVMVFNEDGLFGKTANGSSTTYYCDGLWFNNSQSNYAYIGGSCYSDTVRCGALFAGINVAFSFSRWNVGTSLSCKPLASA